MTNTLKVRTCPAWCTDHNDEDDSHGGDTVQLFGLVVPEGGWKATEAAVQLVAAQRADGSKDVTLELARGFVTMSPAEAEALARTILAQVALISGA